MFDLEKAIEEWQRQMRAAGIRTPAPLDELESHLREDVATQMTAGCEASQAFQRAVSSLGAPAALQAEFASARLPREHRDRTLRLCCLAAGALVYACPLLLNASRILGQMDSADGRLAMAAFALTLLSLFAGFPACRFLPVIAEPRTRTRIQALSFIPILVWFVVLTFGMVPRLECGVGHLSMLTLWAFSPLGVYAGVVFGLDEAARRSVSAA
jgi:hypothetical protein